jgi:hypothetical protein
MKPCHVALTLVLGFTLPSANPSGWAQSAPPQPPADRLIFQTGQPWSPRTNIDADTVMVYGIDATTADRIRSWRDHGYHVTVMTGVAWGRYAPYLRGDFDGKQHWNETQQEKSGQLILHGGREVPYIAPSLSYGRYLAHGVEAALDAGAEGVYLEEPEFWARAGWSDSFKQEWQNYYHQAWQAPDSSPDAQYRASKLKYFLYRRALAQVFASVKAYGERHHRVIPCYVATHSLINYAQWQIVSPESSLLQVGADGYVAQVWTGTARVPNVYEGALQERTFETAFLEYGALQNIARSSGKKIWYLNDPIEDNPNHSWSDYRHNWEDTLTASLLQPAVARYEVLPWPERIFGADSVYPASEPSSSNPSPTKVPIPQGYATELQTVFHALGEMQQPAASTRWEAAGNQGIGVLVSDTLMFQRVAPQPSDPHLGQFYGLALPLLMHGIPVEPVQIESTYNQQSAANFLKTYKVLFLTYEGQKPPSPEFHTALAAWVRAGGVLVVVDNDQDPYNQVREWWNSDGLHYATPRDHLFHVLGLAPDAAGLHAVGKGFVLYSPDSPSALSYSPTGSAQVFKLLQSAVGAVHLPLRQSSALVLRRGPYLIAAGLDQPSNSLPAYTIHGDLIDLFNPELPEMDQFTVTPGARALFLDLDSFPSAEPRIVAAAAKVAHQQLQPREMSFDVESIAQTQGVVLLLLDHRVQSITVGGKPIDAGHYRQNKRILWIHFENTAVPQQIQIRW